MYPRSTSSSSIERTADRPRRLIVESEFTTAGGGLVTSTIRYPQREYGRPWVDTAARILQDLQDTPPTPGFRCQKVRLIDAGAHTVICEAQAKQAVEA